MALSTKINLETKYQRRDEVKFKLAMKGTEVAMVFCNPFHATGLVIPREKFKTRGFLKFSGCIE